MTTTRANEQLALLNDNLKLLTKSQHGYEYAANNNQRKIFISFFETVKHTHGDNTLSDFNRLLDEIRGEHKNIKWLFDVLLRQYYDIRYQVGRALYKCRTEIGIDGVETDTLLFELLKPGQHSKELIYLLKQMDYRRSMLIMLPDLPEYKNQCLQLVSKENVLHGQKKFYNQMDNNLLTSAAQGNIDQFQNALFNGANVNQWDDWGQAVHHIPDKRGQYNNPNDAIKLFHQLLKSGKELEKENGTRKNRNDTWQSNIIPIRWILNNNHFDLALLYCASGYDIIESKVHFYNGLWQSTINHWPAIIQKYLVQEMNKKDGILNKTDLRNTYAFYKAIEAGECPPAENINHDCILWLTAVLGDLKPLRSLPNFSANVNQVIPHCNFSPLMMAIHCGNENVVHFLLLHGAKVNTQFTTIDPHPGPTSDACYTVKKYQENATLKETPNLLFLSFNSKSWIIAQMLINAGIKPTDIQYDQVNEGLKTISLTEEQSIMMRTIHPDPEELQLFENFLGIKELKQRITEQSEQLHALQKKQENDKYEHDKQIEQLKFRIDELKSNEKTEKQIFDAALLNAAELGNVKKMNGVLDSLDADTKAKNNKGQTALHLSVMNNHQAAADLILKKDPLLLMTVDNNNHTPMQRIAAAQQLEMLRWLFEKGRTIPEFSDNQKSFDDVYDVATPKAKHFLANMKLLDACKTEHPQRIDRVKHALSKQPNINAKADDGETALHKAVYNQYIDVAMLLLQEGADPTIRNNKHNEDINKGHETVLDIAKTRKDENLISLIATPYLMCAAEHGWPNDIKIALEAKANLAAADSLGQTALHKAVHCGDIEGIKLLLRKHAETKLDIHIADKKGITPYKLAAKSRVTKKTKTGKKELAVYMIEKFSSYKEQIKFREKQTRLSNSPLSFIAAISQGEGDNSSALNNVQELHLANSNQPENPLCKQYRGKMG